MDEDLEFEDHLLTKVEGNPVDGWTLDMDGMCFHCPNTTDVGEPVDPPPAVGMTARLYGKGFGYTVRGLCLNGPGDLQRVFYRTVEQEEQRHQDWCAEQKREKLAAFEANREEMDRRFAALPEIFPATYSEIP